MPFDLKERVREARTLAIELADPRRSWPEARYESRILCGLLALALLLRAVYWTWNYAMFDDGPAFLYLAQMMEAGNWADAFAHDYHPLYSYLTTLMFQLVPDWERAGGLVSVLAGAGSLLGVYALVRHAMGLRAAWIAGLLYAVQPAAVKYSADVQSEGVYFLFFFLGVAALWRGFDECRPSFAALAGLCSALAYLTRPEGAGIALVGAGLACFMLLLRKWEIGRGALWLAALCLVWLITAGPYLHILKEQDGQWRLTKKKSIAEVVLLDEREPVEIRTPEVVPDASFVGEEKARPDGDAKPRDIAKKKAEKRLMNEVAWEGTLRYTPPDLRVERGLFTSLQDILEEMFSSARPELVLTVIGLCLLGFAPGRRGWFFLAFGVLYFSMFVGLRLSAGYISGRHVLSTVVLNFGYASLGLPLLGSLFARFLRVPHAESKPLVSVAVGLALVSLISLGRQLPPHRASDLAERRVAEWFQSEELPEGLVLVGRRRVAFYAGVTYNELSVLLSPKARSILDSAGVRYIIIEEDRVQRFPLVSELLGSGNLTVLHCETEQGNRACLYGLEGN